MTSVTVHVDAEEERKRETGVRALRACITALVEDEGEDENDQLDVHTLFARVVDILERDERARSAFEDCGGYRALFFYFTESYCNTVGRVFRCLLDPKNQNQGQIAWPTSVVVRLMDIALDGSLSVVERKEAFSLLNAASKVQSMRDGVLIAPSLEVGQAFGETDVDVPSVPLSILIHKTMQMKEWKDLPIECAIHLLCIMKSYTYSSAQVKTLLCIFENPLRSLLWMFQYANDLRGAFEELNDASIPSHIDKVTNATEAEKFMEREKKRTFNQPVVQLKHLILEVFQSVVEKNRECLRTEAFDRKSKISDRTKFRVTPTSLLPDLIAIVKELHALSPLKTAPILGMNGDPKTYAKKRFAADFAKNPFGDAFVEGDDHDKSLLEICLDILIACTQNKNAAITLCAKDIGSILEELGKYVTDSIPEKVRNLYRRLSLACPALASEVCSGDTNIVGLAGIISTGVPELQIKAMDCLLLKLTTCSGDDFFEVIKTSSALDTCYTLLCRQRAACHGTFEDLKYRFRDDKNILEVTMLARSIFLQSLERCRLQKKVQVPVGGAWDTFGRVEVLRMENFLLGKQDTDEAVHVLSADAEEMVQSRAAQLDVGSATTVKDIKKGFLSKNRVRRTSQGKAKLEKRISSLNKSCSPSSPLPTFKQISTSPQLEELDGHISIHQNDPSPQDSDDEDGLRVVWDSAPSDEIRKCRTSWANMDLREKINWTQTSTEITVNVKVPRGTKAKDLEIKVTATRFLFKLKWYGRVFDGPLSRRCKASESWWILEDEDRNSLTQTVQLSLPKDDNHFWRSLFEGGEMKSYYEVLQELVHADEPTPSYEDLPDDAKDLVDEIRERQELAAEGIIDPDIFDDFRCVLSDGDGAK